MRAGLALTDQAQLMNGLLSSRRHLKQEVAFAEKCEICPWTPISNHLAENKQTQLAVFLYKLHIYSHF